MKLSVIILVALFSATLGYAQDASSPAATSPSSTTTRSAPPGAEPNLPGTLVMDFGFNFLAGAPDNMGLRFFKSKGVAFSYLYDMPIGESKFSFHPGLGVGFESYAFDQNVTVQYPLGADSASVVALDANEYQNVIKSKLMTHYVDVPLEFRFYTKQNQRGLMVALGGKVGYLFSSYTKVKYETQGERQVEKLRQQRNFNLNRLRYGASARLGFRGIHLHGQYMFSNLFKDEGPTGNNWRVGLSIALF
ncbi:MAG: outer membrane beta-barrel protein [Tunicatimonas sp.]